jgi:Flp pilus assembly protein TadG
MVRRLVGGSPVGRRSAAAAELALVVPFMVFMFAVAIDYCRVYYDVEVLNNAARSGALYASGTVPAAKGLTPLQAAQQAALAEAVSLGPPLQAQNVTLTSTSTSVTVTVNYQFQTVTPTLGLPPQLAVNASVTMPMAPGASF